MKTKLLLVLTMICLELYAQPPGLRKKKDSNFSLELTGNLPDAYNEVNIILSKKDRPEVNYYVGDCNKKTQGSQTILILLPPPEPRLKYYLPPKPYYVPRHFRYGHYCDRFCPHFRAGIWFSF